ncbi:MAG: carboxypeptidase M32 [Verrucomicrobiota bacterium]
MVDRAYEKLLKRSREVQLVADAQALLSWDQEVLMPKRGIEYRARQMAWLSGWIHEQMTGREIGDWLEQAQNEVRGEIERANLREWAHQYERATCLPADLVKEFAEAQVKAEAKWAEAREKSDFSLFSPSLRQLIDLCRHQADLWGYDEVLYDALIDRFERGAKASRLSGVLSDLRNELIPIVEEATEKPPVGQAWLNGEFPERNQRAFNEEVAKSIGFDFDSGRIDTAVHPFCSGMAPFDTRLTTRYDESDFRSSLFGVLHEAGHGLYEQGLDPERHGEPAGKAVSLGIHESQSRLWENHVGRSRGFWEKWLPTAKEYFPQLKAVSPEEMYRAVNQAELSLVRVEADEVTYDLHILLRFELERALFSGELEVEGIPSEWNRRFESYFGLEVPSDSEGCLQDIHWSMGIFGYFPTYSLGNINAAHLAEAAYSDSPGIGKDMDQGDYQGLLDWMRKHIHLRGSVLLPDDLIEEASGRKVSSKPLIEHLRRRYLDT